LVQVIYRKQQDDYISQMFYDAVYTCLHNWILLFYTNSVFKGKWSFVIVFSVQYYLFRMYWKWRCL